MPNPPKLNRIPELQNEPQSLRLLAAQRQLYSTAKRIIGAQLCISGPIAALTAVAGIFVPQVRDAIAFWGIVVLLGDTMWLSPWQKRLRESAARIQERFDCDVLGLKWDTTRAGSPEPAELVLEQASRYEARANRGMPLKNWYARNAEHLPLALARLVCQRANCWWDAKQRRRYADWMAGLLMLLVVAVLAGGLAAGLSVREMLLVVLLPMASSVKLAHQQWFEHRDAAHRLDQLRSRVDRLWDETLPHMITADLEAEARSLQGEIFSGRRRNPPVFDFVFRRMRDRQEVEMNHGVECFVIKALQLRAASALENVS